MKTFKEKVTVLPDNLLYVIDGKEVDKNVFELTDPDQIESVDVIKGKDEVKKITDRNVEGVIKIRTKVKQ